MRTQAVRMYGKKDIRLDSFELPPIKEGEILARIVSDSICMSTYKAVSQGSDHKRVPDDIADNPVIVGHEFCGELIEIGSKWKDAFKAGDRFAIQPALTIPGNVHAAPGYSFSHFGGAATHVIIPEVVMERNCLLRYGGDSFFHGSLAEPMSCIVGGFHVNYHTEPGVYEHKMGIVPGGALAVLAGAGPMGFGTVDYAVNNPRKPRLVVVTDIDEARLERAERLFPPGKAARQGVRLVYLNTSVVDDPEKALLEISGGKGYDDIFVLAPVPALVEQASSILGFDGCLNFFAGPTDPAFSAPFNFYNVHYTAAHVSGNSGGNTDDLLESLRMMADGIIDPAAMITHVGGLDSVIDTTMNLPGIPGGKKLIYTQISMPLTPLADIRACAGSDPVMKGLADIVEQGGGLWSAAAEDYLLGNAQPVGLDS